jgi:iron complex outermembrane receptor protein
MRKLIALFAAAILCSFMASAQKITGVVKDQQGKGLDKTSIALLRVKDSSIVKLSATDNNGKYSLDGQQGQFLLSFTHVGYAPAYSKSFEVPASGDVSLEDVVMAKAEATIAGVTVTAKKPMVEVKADKTILNVEGTINAVGNDALELLRKAPGVMLDKNGVQIYIDGKPSPLSGTDLTAYLKSLQSSQVESIELITNPSAKYEAAGNAGIINIRLKKNKAFGTNGSLMGNYNIGTYAKYNAGFSLNNRKGKVNLFSNYNYNNSINKNFINLYREVADSVFNQKGTILSTNQSHGFKAGMDYYANSKNTFGMILSGNLNNGDTKTDNSTTIGYKPTGVTDRILLANSSGAAKRNNLNANLNYRFADTSGHELNIDGDYGYYDINSDQLQPNIYVTPNGQTELSRNIRESTAPTRIDIYSTKADYEQNFMKGRLGLGGKIGYVISKNDFTRFNSTSVKSLEVLNSFKYTENINAVYVNYNRQFKKGVMMQAGLRVENTNLRGRSKGTQWDPASGTYVPFKSAYPHHYTDFFPSGAVTFNKNPMSQVSFTYSRRIDRPAYQDLNPFEFRLDDYTYQKGNTLLRPQYTNSIGVTHTYKYRLNTTLNYSHVYDVFTQLVDTANVTRAFISKQNLATQDIVSLNVSYPFQYKSFSAFGNFNGYYSHYRADFGGGSRLVNLDVFAFNIYLQSSIKFGKKKDYTAELSGWYNSPSIWGGTFKSRKLWSIDGGLQKTVFKGKGNIKASVSDIFNVLRWKGVSDFAGQHLIATGGWESRLFKVSMTWRFGSNTVKAARQRKTGSEDENNRVGTQGGGISQ